MSVFRRSIRIVPAVAGLLAVTSAVAAADQPLFTWTGTVDREVMLVMRGRSVETRGVDARLRSSVRVLGDVPRGSGYGDVQVRLESGRGEVHVMERLGAERVPDRHPHPRSARRRRQLSPGRVLDGRRGGRGNGGIGNGAQRP